MWNAIKSDLVSFVNTVTDDTAKVVSLVIGDDTKETSSNGPPSSGVKNQQQMVMDLTRSFSTYSQVPH